MKLATQLKIRKPSGITLLNIVALAMVLSALGNKVAQDHRAQIDSAMRASNRLVKEMLANREMGTVACKGRFE